MSVTTPSQPTKRAGILINRNFGWLWLGQSISFIGDSVFDFTLVIWIAFGLGKGQPWAPLGVSAVLIITSIAMLVAGPIAGVFVDRWDKRRTLLRVMIIQGIGVAAVLLATDIVPLPFLAHGVLPLEWKLILIYVAVFFVNSAAQFTRPSRLALMGDIVPEPQQPQASGLLEVVFNLSFIIGYGVAPVMFTVFGARLAIIIDAASFAIAFLAILLVRAPKAARSLSERQRGHVGREFWTGLRFYFGNRVLRTILVGYVLGLLGAGAINALYVFFITQNLHAPVAAVGTFTITFGIGLLIGALAGSFIVRRLGLTRVFWLSFLMVGVTAIALSRQTSLLPTLALSLLMAFPQGISNVALAPLLLREAPRELVGRATAVLESSIMLAQVISIASAGYIASTVLHGFHLTVLGASFGPYDTLVLLAGVMSLIGGVYVMLNLPHSKSAPISPVRESDPATRVFEKTPAI